MAERVETELIVKAISQGFAGVRKDIENLGKAGKGAGEDFKGANRSLGDMVQTIGRVQAGALVMAGVFKEAFDLAKEGAAIQRTSLQLDRLAATIGTTAESITTKLSAATRGMISDAQLAASATQIISLGLGKTEDEVVRLATVVGRLGLDMNQVILTFANNSVMRLDALGLAVDDVRARAAAFEAQGFDANKAFDTAVLEALEEKLKVLGGGVDDNAAIFARFETQIKNVSDAFKTWLADGLTPVLAALSGTNARVFDGIIEGQRAAAESLEDYIETGQRLSEVGSIWLGLGVVVSGNERAHHAALTRVAQDIANASGSFEEFERAFDSAFDRNARYNIMGLSGDLREFYDNAALVRRLGDALDNAYQPAASRAATATAQLAAAAEDSGIAIRDGTGAVAGWVGMMQMLGTGTSTAALSARELAGATYEVRDAAAESLPEVKTAWDEVFGATDAAKGLLEEYKGLLTGAETAEQKLAIVNLAEAWGIVTKEEAEANRTLIEMEETHNRVVNNMAVVLRTNLAGGWNDAWGAMNSYRNLLLELEGINPPTPGGAYPGGAYPGGGSPPPGGTGGSGDNTGSYGGPPPGAVPPPMPGGTGGYGGPGGNAPQAAQTNGNTATYNIYVNGQMAAQIQGRMTAGTLAAQIGVRG